MRSKKNYSRKRKSVKKNKNSFKRKSFKRKSFKRKSFKGGAKPKPSPAVSPNNSPSHQGDKKYTKDQIQSELAPVPEGEPVSDDNFESILQEMPPIMVDKFNAGSVTEPAPAPATDATSPTSAYFEYLVALEKYPAYPNHTNVILQEKKILQPEEYEMLSEKYPEGSSYFVENTDNNNYNVMESDT